ncbi:sensor histidine kinase [Aestuariimicrobium sp. p3-SID1156]|uniref:sensor histidine kinase n=1 Tax=Aestuariimicrobium sp. p3-SID1156 TaxID=2916038 RepID=UPI00223BA39C|nr:sensor histidine kinase [Aestuariimicrobium sp. p3-SID1156]MCT1459308.1 sensor histidine kinase [Aestuariimicrobium sp. p3-SID1156]
MTFVDRVLRWLGAEDDWQRPRPRIGRSDWLVAGFSFLLAAMTVEALRSFVGPSGTSVWQQYLTLATAGLLLIFRRRYPIVTMVALGLHFFIACTWVPEVGYSFTYQMIPFLGLYSGMSWARERKAALMAAIGLALGFVLWLTWMFALGRALEGFNAEQATGRGLFSPAVGAVIYTAICNAIYFFAAFLMGAGAWNQARQHAAVVEQARIIQEQSEDLARGAVLADRLRLAQELHDVVAHHVAVTGVQAGAARKLLSRDPEQAALALANVEASSRDAVGQMRDLLGTLRADDADQYQPTVGDLPSLVDSVTGPGFEVDLQVIEDAPGAAERLPLPVGLCLYRITQESLSNVRRHSTAHGARVVLRVDSSRAEVEVTDDGRPLGNTSGSRFGQQGIRERVNALGGELDMGPRLDGGYRVRARMPLS